MPDRDIFPHHFTAKQTAWCAVWRGAPLKAQVSFPAPKQSTPLCGCAFVLRNRIQTRLEGGAASGSEHFARPRYSPAPLHGKTNSTVCCLAGRAAKGASLVSRSKTKHTPCGCVFVLRNRIQTRLEGGAASGSEHFARPRYSPAPLHGKTNSTVCCLAGRAAKGASLVSRSKTKHTPCGCVFVLRNRIKRDLRVELRAGASILPDRDILPHHFTAKQTARCAVWRGAPPFSMAPLCKGSCQRQLTEGLYGVSLHFFGEKM